MKVTVTVCDICEDRNAETKRYEVKEGGRKVAVELCEQHGQPLEGYLARTPTPAKKVAQKRSAATRKRTPRVTSIEEIEKLKRK
jgi:hypothetical protein